MTLLERLQERNLTLIKDKCKIGMNQIVFIGLIFSLRSKRFRLVSEQRNTEEEDLTLVPRSFLLNRTETLATQAN